MSTAASDLIQARTDTNVAPSTLRALAQAIIGASIRNQLQGC